MKRAIIFDLDGTLIDTPSGIVATFLATIQSMNLAFTDAAAIRSTIGQPLEKAFSDLLAIDRNDERISHAVRQYQLLFKDIVLPKAKELIFPGVREGLHQLKTQGFALAVATSKVFKSAESLLKAADLWDFFDVVVCADLVSQPKPHPEMGYLVMEKLGVRADHAVMVGDTTHDMLMAKGAKMRSIGVTYGIHDREQLQSATPDWITETFAGVLEYATTIHEQMPLVTELLNDASHHIEFNGHLSNHNKHAVIALNALGATPEQIKTFYHNYARLTPYGYGLEAPRMSKHVITQENWQNFLGKRTSYSSYCQFFAEKEKELGRRELLKQYLPILVPGWVGAFTHATIHTGWALDVNHRWMLIEGLAYMAFSYVSCHPERATLATSDESETVLDSLLKIGKAWEENAAEFKTRIDCLHAENKRADEIHPELLRSGLQFQIANMLAEGHSLFYATPSWINNSDHSHLFQQLYYVTTLIYLSKPGDFIILHLLTSLHAMEMIALHLPKAYQSNVIHNFWIGMLGILFSRSEFPTKTILESLHKKYLNMTDTNAIVTEGPQWNEMMTRAIQEKEEHNPKMVYVLKRWWEITGYRSIFRIAANYFTTTPVLPKSFELPPNE